MIRQIDEWMQSRVDAGMGILENWGIHAPTVLREMTVASMLSSAVLTVAALAIPELWFISYLMAGMLVGGGYWAARRWLSFDVDARRDWSAALARKYSQRALRMRHDLRNHRLLNLVFAPFLYSAIIHVALSGVAVWLVLAFGVRFAIMALLAYVEGSIPLPPPQRAPAGAALSGA